MSDETRKCRECGRELALELFKRHARGVGGFDTICRDCHRLTMQTRRTNDPEFCERERAYQRGPGSVVAKRWRRSPHGRAYYREWAKSRPDVALAAAQRRKERMAENGGSHTAAEWETLLELSGGTCLACGLNRPLTKDHVRPVAEGGVDSIENLQPLCMWCNSKKGTTTRDFRVEGIDPEFRAYSVEVRAMGEEMIEIETSSGTKDMIAEKTADLMFEARVDQVAAWLRGEVLRQVREHMKQHAKHIVRDLMDDAETLNGDVAIPLRFACKLASTESGRYVSKLDVAWGRAKRGDVGETTMFNPAQGDMIDNLNGGDAA